jgi:hypothetical protein
MLTGTIGEISARIDHRDDRGLEQWKRRHDAYAAWETERALRLDTASLDALTPRQRTKYASLDRRWLPAAYFADEYIRRCGCLDGIAGFWHAWHKAHYFADIGRRIRAARRAARR